MAVLTENPHTKKDHPGEEIVGKITVKMMLISSCKCLYALISPPPDR